LEFGNALTPIFTLAAPTIGSESNPTACRTRLVPLFGAPIGRLETHRHRTHDHSARRRLILSCVGLQGQDGREGGLDVRHLPGEIAASSTAARTTSASSASCPGRASSRRRMLKSTGSQHSMSYCSGNFLGPLSRPLVGLGH
jgi:hypothetical protein